MARRKRMHPKKRQRIDAESRQATQATRTRVWRARVWRIGGYLALLFVLAVALRIFRLTEQSLWADEGNSVRLTERPLNLVIDAARADVHPPGYYLVLWGWVRLFGQGEVAVRSLSVAAGVALVGLVYLLGQRVYGRRAGWLAALCAGVAPFQVRYSQEVRMYIVVALLGTGMLYAFVRWLQEVQEGIDRPWRWSILYVVVAAAGLWTHYSFPIVLAALNIVWLVWWIGRRSLPGWGKVALWWGGMHVVSAILYLPWLPIAWSRIFGYGPISEGYAASYIVAQALKLLSVGETVPDDDLIRWLTLGTVGLSVFGAWGGLVPSGASLRKQMPKILTLSLIAVVVAPIVMMVALAWVGRPAYRPKFFLVASPAFCLLVGLGIALLERPERSGTTWTGHLWLLLGLGVIGAGSVRSLRNYYFDPAYARSDYRAIAADVESIERESDAILLNAPNQWEVFTYYHHGHVPVYPLCRSRPPIEASVVAELEEIAAKHDRLFALYWAAEESDPERIVERWLEANTFSVSDSWYGDVRLVIYAVPRRLSAAEMQHSLPDVRLGETIALRGYTIIPDNVQRGDILQATLFWEALDVPDDRYKVFLHLVDASGQIVSQHDGEPGDGMNLTTNWRPGRVFSDRYGLLVPLALADGEYRLLMGMYDIRGEPRLPILVAGEPTGDALTLAVIGIQ